MDEEIGKRKKKRFNSICDNSNKREFAVNGEKRGGKWFFGIFVCGVRIMMSECVCNLKVCNMFIYLMKFYRMGFYFLDD